MKYDIKDAHANNNDEFILSKGHAAPVLYSALYRAGAVSGDLNSLRKFGSKFEGHPLPAVFPWAKVSSGSLGQGLSVGVGMAMAAKLDGREYGTYVLLGDSEMAEGSNYEAMQLASFYKLSNLTVIVDINRLGQRGETMLGHNAIAYKKRFESFGWKAIIVDGHNVNEILASLKLKIDRPKVILALTLKGKGFSFVENKDGWHGKALDEGLLSLALKRIPDVEMPKFTIEKRKASIKRAKTKKVEFSDYRVGSKLATRVAYGNALHNLAKSDSSVLVLDGETSNSTYADSVKGRQFVESFIAEQNMVGMALGLSKKGYNVFASSFAAFLSRAHDQLRMASLSTCNMTICGSHAGVSIGADGGSQMGLDDLAMFRGFLDSSVFYPSDATSTEKLVVLASRLKGLKYIRTTRSDTPVIYGKREKFEVGDFKVLKDGREIVLVGAGITLHECLKASKNLKGCSVIDLYCVKPFDAKKFVGYVKKHGRRVVVVEDHFKQGGIGEMLASCLVNSGVKMKHLCVRKIPRSGSKEQLMKAYGIDSDAIVGAVKGRW
jgi:transketolase